MKEPRFWSHRYHPMALALAPLGRAYGGLVALRRHWTKPTRLNVPLICVGNFTLGGAGKTPIVRLVANMLAKDEKRVAIISRGYGGAQKQPLRVDPKKHDAAQIGDEPLMLAQAGFDVFVARDRRAAARAALAAGAQILIKDDGFQNPQLHHTRNLLVVDAASGLGNGRVFPSGPLRERLAAGLARADALIVSRGDKTAPHASIAALSAAFAAAQKPIFHAEARLAPLRLPRAIAFCGIAKPQKFAASLDAAKTEIVEWHIFADHHRFTEAQAARLIARASKMGLPLVTTEKDHARLYNAPPQSARARLMKIARVAELRLRLEKPARFAAFLNALG